MLKYFGHLSFLITMANAKFCPFEDKTLYSKSHRICIYSQGWETGPKPALWFYEPGCEEGFHRLPSANVITSQSGESAARSLALSGLFKWLLLDEFSCHLCTRHDRVSLIKIYWSGNLFLAIKKLLINEMAIRAINNTEQERGQELSGNTPHVFLNSQVRGLRNLKLKQTFVSRTALPWEKREPDSQPTLLSRDLVTSDWTSSLWSSGPGMALVSPTGWLQRASVLFWFPLNVLKESNSSPKKSVFLLRYSWIIKWWIQLHTKRSSSICLLPTRDNSTCVQYDRQASLWVWHLAWNVTNPYDVLKLLLQLNWKMAKNPTRADDSPLASHLRMLPGAVSAAEVGGNCGRFPEHRQPSDSSLTQIYEHG